MHERKDGIARMRQQRLPSVNLMPLLNPLIARIFHQYQSSALPTLTASEPLWQPIQRGRDKLRSYCEAKDVS